MIQLDYRTNNPRWGLRGVVFSDWKNEDVPATQMHHIFPKNEYPDIKY